MAAPIQQVPTSSFFPLGNTVALTVGTVSANAAVGTVSRQALLTNVGSNVVYVALGTDDTIVAAIPVSGTPENGIPVLPNSQIEIQLGSGTYVAAIAAATGNTLFITPGVAS